MSKAVFGREGNMAAITWLECARSSKEAGAKGTRARWRR
jgi:hypothetical protein